jgi:membrane fusion protein, multidrug efflux system
VSHAINRSEPGTHGRQRSGLLRARSTIAVVVTVLVFGAAWWSRSYFGSNPGAGTSPPPEVVVTNPLLHELDTRLGFLGQLTAANEVELRAQVGGTLKEIHFKDGDIVQGALPEISRLPTKHDRRPSSRRIDLVGLSGWRTHERHV